MHEMALAASVLDIVLEAAAECKASKVLSIRLAVGEMTGAAPEALQFCFGTIANGTSAADSKLVIDILPIVCRCRSCDKHFSIEQYRFVCPECNATAIETISGNELRVDEIEVE